MRPLPALLMAMVLIVAVVGLSPQTVDAQPAPASVQMTHSADHTLNDTGNASDVPPGARLTATIGVQGAELEGEVETRTYGIKIARAATADAKADVVGEELGNIEARLSELEARKQALNQARDNGSIGEAQFRARMAELAARTSTVKQLSNQTTQTADDLPVDLLEQKAINTTAIMTLSERADELTGPEVARIARSIAGPNVGQSIVADPGPPNGDGPSGAGDAASAIERADRRIHTAEEQLARAEQRVNGTNASENATDALVDARSALDRARSALADAEAALDAENTSEALTLAEDALDHADEAVTHARDALHTAREAGQSGHAGQREEHDGSDRPNDTDGGGSNASDSDR